MLRSASVRLAFLALAASASLFACAEPESETPDELEEELRLFPDPRCPGPIAMSKRSYAALPANYERLTATEKSARLWKVMSDATYASGCRPSSGLFLSAFASGATALDIKPTVERASDEMPPGRRKMVHPFGAVATFDFVKDPGAAAAGYSGVLDAKGSPVRGVIRASLGGDPNVIGFTPGIAVKFLVDGRPSLNVVAMHSLMGQGKDKNFFRHPFSNELNAPHADLGPNPSVLDYAKADAFLAGQNLVFLPALARGPKAPTPNFLHVDHLGRLNADGSIVPRASQKTPSHLVFRAPQKLATWWDVPQNRSFDYRDLLAALPVGTNLYEVYGKATSTSPEVRLGVLRTTSKFVASTWGDHRLFFRHNDHQNNADVGR